MTSAAKVALILGAGPNIGHHVAQALKEKGYKVALTSRSSKESENTPDQIHIAADLSDPDSVVRTFSQVKASLGLPSVVVYNAASATVRDAKDPLSVPLTNFTRSLAINTTSAFVAAQQAVEAFSQLPESASKTFIYTGNLLNTRTMPSLLDLGTGKSATAHIIRAAAEAYADRGFKFYYADERKADGTPPYNDIDGAAHAKHYVELADGDKQGPWQQTFVKGVGYKAFPTN